MSRSRLRTFALSAAGAYLGIVALAWQFQARILYPGTWRVDSPPPADVRLATYRAADGIPVHALELDTPGARETIVYFHGNGEVVGDDIWMARDLQREGFSVVLAEYRGYGHSRPGDPTEAGLYADAEAVLAGLASRGVDAKHVVLWGASLGSGVAAEMATRGRGTALVLVTPYTSIPDVAAIHFPWLPARLLVRDQFATLGKAAAIGVPTFVLHGTSDEVVPFAMGEHVAGAIHGATFARVDGGRHTDLFLGKGLRNFAVIAAFLRQQP
jgi:fermentation-respiration switch protein FrsA (DUF1100 family)